MMLISYSSIKLSCSIIGGIIESFDRYKDIGRAISRTNHIHATLGLFTAAELFDYIQAHLVFSFGAIAMSIWLYVWFYVRRKNKSKVDELPNNNVEQAREQDVIPKTRSTLFGWIQWISLLAIIGLAYFIATMSREKTADEKPAEQGNMAAQSKLAEKSPVFTDDKSDIATTRSSLDAVINYRRFENRDIDGDPIAKLQATDREQCEGFCRQNKDCLVYSFNKWAKLCLLKAHFGMLKINPRSLSGIRDDLQTPLTDTFEMKRFRGKAFPPPGYRVIKGSNFESCESSCQSDAVCVAFTFMKDVRSCHLLSTTGEYFPNSGADSGTKQ